MEKLSRRKVLTTLAAAGAGAAVGATANARDREKPNLREQEARLRNVLNHVETANDHMNRVSTGWAAPPEPTRPAFDALLTSITSECQSVMDTASALLLNRGA